MAGTKLETTDSFGTDSDDDANWNLVCLFPVGKIRCGLPLGVTIERHVAPRLLDIALHLAFRGGGKGVGKLVQ